MRYYPLAIDSKDKKILVVGGGRAANLKLKQLVKTLASITVVSKQFSNEVIELKKVFGDKIILESRTIDINNINIDVNYTIVFICTENKELNLKIFKYYNDNKVMAMMTNNKEASDFITMATMEKENITVSVSTGGRSPSASKILLNEVEKTLNTEFIEKINLLCEIRELLVKEKSYNYNKENISDIIESLILYSNEDLLKKLKIMREIKC
ncbi:siroheme synthase-like protein [Sedimentibacter acidaminivorans]|uniref:precorrin-2 dehydrogenase n=1 Tax=Sedimentibacter acidaminivorans TaxID=913099 RepID=A0ABS4GEN3_9FIRM|nr:bifunctional precorrin-2 dehydrogenase/sirohydrochlorin ferrochelatase [Sedimentibacter acidaminivorans]MBP1926163.1 siroheme synthase-like protein [Sedimentibacter acidaminivorans]